MTAPVFEIHLFRRAAGLGWEYSAKRRGKTLVQSSRLACHEHPRDALESCVTEVWQIASQSGPGGKNGE